MSSKLNELFERTMPPEHVVLERMNAARRERETKRVFHSSRIWALAGVACAAVAAALLVRVPTAPPLRAEAERFEPAPARASGAAVPTPPLVLETSPMASASAAPARTASKRAIPSIASAAEPAPAPASWEAAARALREGDQAEAQRLLAELSKSDEPEVRDSALLVRLRSSLPELSAAERAQLENLASSGATASIRSDARKLLEEVRAAQQ